MMSGAGWMLHTDDTPTPPPNPKSKSGAVRAPPRPGARYGSVLAAQVEADEAPLLTPPPRRVAERQRSGSWDAVTASLLGGDGTDFRNKFHKRRRRKKKSAGGGGGCCAWLSRLCR